LLLVKRVTKTKLIYHLQGHTSYTYAMFWCNNC